MSAPFGRRRQHVTARSAANVFIFLAIFQILIPSSSASASISSFLPTQTDATATSTSTIEFSAGVLLESSVLNQLAQFTSIPPVPLPKNISGYDTFSQMANLMPPFQATVGTVEPDITAMLASIKVSAAASINKGLSVGSLTGRQAAIRVMIVGDSMTQGQQGDWTWRYRIWEWFKEQGIDVDFVGPYAGTVEPDPPSAPAPPPLYGAAPPTSSIKSSGGYAAGASVDFDSDHFAVWGRAAAVDKGLIQDVVAAHQADLMLLMLGFNDMGWFYSDAQGTLDSIHTLITNARAANPNLKFAVANVPQRSFIGGREDLPLNTDIYNSLLSNSIPRWSTTQSPIYLVELQENYSCDITACPVGYDGLHPNALGEYQIARAFTVTLVKDFQLGTSPLTIPSDIPARPLQPPSNFQVSSSPGGAMATWDAVYGSYGYEVQSRISGITDFSSGTVSSNRWDARWPVDGFTYDVRVRASAGDTSKSDWTSLLSITAHSITAPGPLNVVVGATATGFDVSWDPPTGPYTDSILEYNILFWDKDGACDYITGAAFASSPAHIDGLVPGHHYLVALITWNKDGEGFPEVVHSVTVGAGIPKPPTGLSIISNDPTTIHMTWDGSAIAAGYQLWFRNVNEGNTFSKSHTVDVTCADIGLLFPGTWNYEWCISAYNGNDVSLQGDCVVAPSPVSGSAPITCPPAPAWCPSGPGGGGGGGATSTILPPGSSSTSTSTSAPTSSNLPGPVVTNGQCKGPDCTSGHCTGILCVSVGCSGSSCLNGVCTGLNCIVLGCIGSGCTNGVCTSLNCVTSGCVGRQCGNYGHCTGDDCISIGCSGPDCGSNGVCTGPDCFEHSCSGADCVNGGCAGPSCTGLDGCRGSDCNNGECTGPDCSSCSGPDCHNSACTGLDCIGCSGSDCHNGQCTGSNCSSCTGSDCHNGQCTGPNCSGCAGSDCDCSRSKCGCKGPNCSSCTGLDCSCTGLFCGCHSPLCSACIGIGCSCVGLTCSCLGPGCSSCKGSGCTCSGSSCNGGDSDDNTTTSCEVSTTVTNCGVGCSVTDYGDTSLATACFTTQCSTVAACDSVGVTTTSTTITAICPLTPIPYSRWTPANPNAPPQTLGSDNKYSSSGAKPSSTTHSTTIHSTATRSTTKPLPPTSTTNPPSPTWTPNYVYNCDGSTLCNTLNVKFCDEAVNRMVRGDHIYTANSLLAISGNCWANSYGYGCKVVIQGEEPLTGLPCTITGDKMWEVYQDIREFGGCSRCGNRYDDSFGVKGNGCRVTIDYMSGCDNRDGGVNLLPGSKVAPSATSRE